MQKTITELINVVRHMENNVINHQLGIDEEGKIIPCESCGGVTSHKIWCSLEVF